MDFPYTQPLATRFTLHRTAPWLTSLLLHAGLLSVAGAWLNQATVPATAPLQLLITESQERVAPVSLRAAVPPAAVPKPKATLPPPSPTTPATIIPATQSVPAPALVSVQSASAGAPSSQTSVIATAPSSNVVAAPVSAALNAPTPLSPARADAAYLNNPTPAYPAQSRRLGELGTVQLLVKVSAVGNVESLVVHRSSGYARLDEAARVAVLTWRFVPARRGAQAEADTVIVPVVFRD